MTRVLITNDDGIEAPGLAALAFVARRAGFDVVVAAPSQEMSGMSAALKVERTDGKLPLRRTAAGFAVDGTPASIVGLAARGAFGEPPDVVLSGINRGANVGIGILHSGTVGAVLTAANGRSRSTSFCRAATSPSHRTTSCPGRWPPTSRRPCSTRSWPRRRGRSST
jgi:5'-nucleotidase